MRHHMDFMAIRWTVAEMQRFSRWQSSDAFSVAIATGVKALKDYW